MSADPPGHVEDRETRHFIRRLPISPAPSKISHSQTPRALDGLQTYLLLPCPYLSPARNHESRSARLLAFPVSSRFPKERFFYFLFFSSFVFSVASIESSRIFTGKTTSESEVPMRDETVANIQCNTIFVLSCFSIVLL